ncbi:MAG TPA: hypothetical protein VFA04_27260 [Bryobacteraceae bacterium]|nr:hypothetical protein [Bryobacteraceae bacterium]
MEFQLKPISRESIPQALAKAERYRLLNEPDMAESICLDILAAEPTHQQSLVVLLLARTDQFGSGVSPERAREVLQKMVGEYDRAYYAGIIWERAAHAQLRRSGLGSNSSAYHAFREAMACYEKAQAVRPAGNDDSILRWNTCARILMRNADLRPLPHAEFEPILSE